MHKSKRRRWLAVLGLASMSTGLSASVQLNQLMIMMDEPTPCQGVAVRFAEGSRKLGEFTVLTNGVINPRGTVKSFPTF
ncbi:hypothetical protein GCM10008955_23340 [Deinococcus malanensis]|uniref:Uncharacterized protein n=1 Tax=Deinococcus malanensis TaxID=1706855 RepID=A0ABQ2EZU9_9DEIO|nr:hypothetical protein GCM10008955_23340 [Deinococcus malanensis]